MESIDSKNGKARLEDSCIKRRVTTIESNRSLQSTCGKLDWATTMSSSSSTKWLESLLLSWQIRTWKILESTLLAINYASARWFNPSKERPVCRNAQKSFGKEKSGCIGLLWWHFGSVLRLSLPRRPIYLQAYKESFEGEGRGTWTLRTGEDVLLAFVQDQQHRLDTGHWCRCTGRPPPCSQQIFCCASGKDIISVNYDDTLLARSFSIKLKRLKWWKDSIRAVVQQFGVPYDSLPIVATVKRR